LDAPGGGAAIMVDQLALRGLSVRGPSHELLERMSAAGAPVPHSLIAGLGLAGARHDVVSAALRELQDHATAREMIAEVRGLKVLAGYRGAPAGDLDALADTVVALSRLAVEQPAVVEAEANPVRVHTSGAVALDALVRTAAPTRPA
jgi:hypothetical protein